MGTSQHDGERLELMLQKQLRERLDQFKAEVAQRPFFCITIAFLAGLFSWTFPVRLVLSALLRLLCLLLGPAILLMGMLKISELFSEATGRAPSREPI